MITFGEVGKLLGLLFERPARLVELRDRGQKLSLGGEQPLLTPVSALERTEARRRDHQPDGRGKQERRGQHRVAPGEEMIIDGRSKRHPRQSPRQHPHSGELIAAMLGLDADRAALNVAGCGGFCAGREGRQGQIGSVLSPFIFDHAAVAIDEHRLREALVGMSLKNAAKNFGF